MRSLAVAFGLFATATPVPERASAQAIPDNHISPLPNQRPTPNLGQVDTVIVQNWFGPTGAGDQGGFVVISFPAVTNVNSYRICREIETGKFILWAIVHAEPGTNVIRTLVPTLDGEATRWAVTPIESSKFLEFQNSPPVSPDTKAAVGGLDGYVPALLNVQWLVTIPESELTISAKAVRAADEIPPQPVANTRVTATAKGFLVEWDLSADDRFVGETQLPGVDHYEVRRQIGNTGFKLIATVPWETSSFEDTNIPSDMPLEYRVDTADLDNVTIGNPTGFARTLHQPDIVSTAGETAPTKTVLHQCSLNPFNPGTTIRYELAKSGLVRLHIQNSLGQAVRTLVSRNENIGRYQVFWDGKDETGQFTGSGIYSVVLNVGSFTQTQKILLLK